jgi:ABC-2 type transport system ATP-binding protein
LDDKSTTAIKAHGLAKRFDDVDAVKGASFEVFPGELVRLSGTQRRGENHDHQHAHRAGQTGCGQYPIGDIDCIEKPRAAQHLIGVVPDESNLYPELTGFENLCFCARFMD